MYIYVCVYIYICFPSGSVVRNLPANAGDVRDVGSIPGSGRSPGGGHGNHSSILSWRIPVDGGAWQTTVNRVAKSWTRLKQLTSHAWSLNLK